MRTAVVVTCGTWSRTEALACLTFSNACSIEEESFFLTSRMEHFRIDIEKYRIKKEEYRIEQEDSGRISIGFLSFHLIRSLSGLRARSVKGYLMSVKLGKYLQMIFVRISTSQVENSLRN